MGAMELTPIEFPRFSELPKSIRIRIWTHAAFVPRIVELHEHYSTTVTDGKQEHQTAVLSRTRPPALLQACDEARRVALTIYKPMYSHAHSNVGQHSPIYVNPLVDITYRGMEANPLMLFGPDHKKDAVPLGVTRRLAVHSKLLTQDRISKTHRSRHAPHGLSIVQQILACATHGLEELILVVGNDEDDAEFELEDVDLSCLRAKDALLKAVNLSNAAHKKWDHKCWEGAFLRLPPFPRIKVMKPVKSKKPIPPFHQFSRLPQELQNAVWEYASRTRRVISVAGTRDCAKVEFSHRSQPPLLSVCRASRSIAMKKLTRIPVTSESKPGWYNKSLDVVILPRFDRHPQAFAGWEIKYLGLYFRGMDIHDSYFIKPIEGVKKVIIIIGECHPNSEVMLVPITEPYEVGKDGVRFSGRYSQARDKVYQMRTELERVAGKWNRHQEKKEEGDREPDWTAPIVKAANMIPISQVVSPYSYDYEDGEF